MSNLPHDRLRAVLSADVGLTVLLVSLTVVLFVIYPFVPLSTTGRLLVTVGLTAVLISGSFSLGGRSSLRLTVIGLAVVAFTLHWLQHAVPGDALLALSYGSTILFLVLTAAGVLARVLRAGPVNTHRIQGAVAVYLMMGLLWGFAYGLVEIRHPGSFSLPESPAAAPQGADLLMSDLSYFSFVTLTTLGYGDLTPKTSSARTLATLEALVGQLYLVILIAWLVSLRAAGGQGGTRPPSEDLED